MLVSATNVAGYLHNVRYAQAEITGYPYRGGHAQPSHGRVHLRQGSVVRFINAAYAKYLGLRPEEAIGRHITELIPTSGIPAVLRSRKAELRQIRRFPTAARR